MASVVRIIGAERLARMARFPELLAMRLMIAWQNQITLATRGDILQQRTGRLTKSWQVKPTMSVHPGAVRVRLGSSLVYARIHEYGGRIVPRKGKWLRFQTGWSGGQRSGGWATVASVTIPARRYVSIAGQRALQAARGIAAALKRELMAGPVQ